MATTPAVWSHDGTPAPHEVTLFRHRFTLDEPLPQPTLEIFADTRYEVWLDGRWLGRGPARFSATRHEYDGWPLPDLEPGSHLLAVLVQWSPNQRRSESGTPLLRATLRGEVDGRDQVVARTGPEWRTLPANAWRVDAPLVHQWNLIGSSEVLDLRALPAGWQQAGFDDAAWANAVLKSPSPVTLQARTIPPLAEVAIEPQVLSVGWLAPGEQLLAVTEPTTMPLTIATAQALTLTALHTGAALRPDGILVDGSELAWQPTSGHPDLRLASLPVEAGEVQLSIVSPPQDGLTLSVPRGTVAPGDLPPLERGHAGQRLLLAEPINDGSAVTVSAGTMLTLDFPAAPAFAVLDLGRVVHGRLIAEVAGPAGAVVDIGWDERLWQGERPLPFPGSLHPQWNQTDSWILDGSARALSTLDTRAGRYILIAVWSDQPVSLSNLRVLEERYPVTSQGTFSTANPRLTQMWQIGQTTLYPNMTDGYTDTPWRERGQWWGDAYVQYHINRVSFGDSALFRRGLVLMGESFQGGRPMALAPNGEGTMLLDFGMLWVQGLQAYSQHTGETALLAESYPTLQAFLAFLAEYEHTPSGLLELPYGYLPQSALIDWAGATSQYGVSTALNAMYYGTLLDAAAIADQLGHPEQAAVWRLRAAQVRAQANALLYDAAQGRYHATLYQGQPLAPSPHAQAWPLAYGLVPAADEARVADALLALLSPDPAAPNVEIYGMFWVLEALGQVDRVSDAIPLLERYYGRLLDLGATTWWEGFNAHLRWGSSLSHGWGGAPTWFLTTYFLGARQLSPTTWQVRPTLESHTATQGALPMAGGTLDVAWDATDCSQLRLTLTAPPTTSGEVVWDLVPSMMLTLTLDGMPIWANGTPLAEGVVAEADGIHVPLGAGSHGFEAQRPCQSLYLPLVSR